MRRMHVFGGLLMGILFGASPAAHACGDKFLVISRGAQRVPRAHHPATILLYVRPGSDAAAAAQRASLESTLKKAGHSVDAVDTSAAVSSALKNRGYDLVLADLTDASALARELRASAPAIEVIPLAIKADAAVAAKSFATVVQIPIRGFKYLSALDDASGRRAKAIATR